MISDGAGDERILPVLKTKINIISTQQVIVKQSAKLESTYYMITDFVRDVLSDKQTAHLFFGVPAVALVLYALFGAAAWRFILGVIGAYLFIRGFKLESHFAYAFNAVFLAAKRRQGAFFLYVLGASATMMAALEGHNAATHVSGPLEKMLVFVNSSIFLFFMAVAFVLSGRAVSIGRRALPAYVTYLFLSFASAWTVYEVTRFGISPSIGYASIEYSVLISGIVIIISILVERKLSK